MHISDRASQRPKIKQRATRVASREAGATPRSRGESTHEKCLAGNDRAKEMRPDPTPAEQPPTQTDQTGRPTPQQREDEGGDTFKIPLLPVYRAIVEHQVAEEGWAGRDELVWLRDWCRTFIREFQIKTRDSTYLLLPLIKIEPLNIKTLVTFRAGRDGYAIAGTIVVNLKRLERGVPRAALLAQLLVALMRAWQRERCDDDLFDSESLARFRQLGLRVAKAGITIEGEGHFWKLLEEHKVEDAAGEVPMAKLAGRSTLELWSCLCQRARVGTESFAVRCLLCGAEFHPGDNVVKKAQSAKGARRRVAAKQAVAAAATRAAEHGVAASSQPAP